MARLFAIVMVLASLAPLDAHAEVPHVVIILIDGLPAYLLDDPNASMPEIRRLAREGVAADDGMTVADPSMTWPNMTTLITGAIPIATASSITEELNGGGPASLSCISRRGASRNWCVFRSSSMSSSRRARPRRRSTGPAREGPPRSTTTFPTSPVRSLTRLLGSGKNLPGDTRPSGSRRGMTSSRTRSGRTSPARSSTIGCPPSSLST